MAVRAAVDADALDVADGFAGSLCVDVAVTPVVRYYYQVFDADDDDNDNDFVDFQAYH